MNIIFIFNAISNMKMLKKCLCLILVLMTMMTVVSVAPVTHIHAASASDYISQSYASNITIKTTKTTSLMSMPSTASGSSVKYTIPADTVLVVKALHKNKDSKYFYEVTYYNLTLYVDATATTMLDHLTGDITLTDKLSPSSLTLGNGFPIKGNIKSTRNVIKTVTASMYNGTNITRDPVLTSSDTINGKSYNLTNSTVDVNLNFSLLAKGSYTYMVSVDALSYYIDSSGSLKESITEVILDQQICVVTNGSSPNPVLHNGIDVSVWNGNIDWAKVKSQVDFAIIRASWEETADTKFTTNANGCINNGIPWGVYVYSYAENAAEAKGEAEYILSLLDGYDMDLPVFFDFEDECQMNLGAAKQQEIVKAFCDTIYAGGRQPGLYTYVWLLRSVFTDSYYRSIPMWTAEINGASYTSYKGGLWMWQWSWVGQFNGMSGDVDCNKMYVDLPGQNKSDTSYLSKCTYYPSNCRGTVTQEYNMREYPSTDYSSIRLMNIGDEVHITGLYKNAYGNYWYQIEYNGKTGYIDASGVRVDWYLYYDVTVTNPKMASNLALGKGFYIEGDITSKYTQLNTVNAKVYSGENTLTTPTLKSSVNTTKKTYDLYKSSVDYGLNFGLLAEGYYTYEISADVTLYYVNNGTLTSKTGNVVLWRTPFTVGSASITPPETNVCVHNIATDAGKAPTCTEQGLTIGTRCTLCGEVISEQEVIPALGHNYTKKLIEATCVTSSYYQYTCENCGSEYKEYLNQDWLETRPEGYSDNQLETKTQYRTSSYSEVKNNNASINGGTQIKKEWQVSGNDTTIVYAKTWPDGFEKSNSFYTKYNITPKTNSESGNTKYEVIKAETSAKAWIYWHWCRNYQYGPINRTTSLYKTGDYTTFHAFYSTEDPATKDKGAATDGSVQNPNSDACKDAIWFYNVPLYTQTYRTYKALYTHAVWSDWSEWSDVPATATDTLKVETRTLYRIKDLANHRFSRGRCLVCDYVCTHEWENGKCNICLMSCMHKWVNGECSICKQPCTHSWQSGVCTICSKVCSHSWKDGICENCGIGCAHNWVDGTCTICNYICYPHAYRDGVCAVCHTPCPGHIWDGSICEVCGMNCEHNWIDGECTLCHKVCTHSFVNGSCGVCGISCDHDWVNGKCTICTLICKHNYVDGVCTQCAKVCTHNWHNGMCTTCNIKCSHSWENGYCTVCGIECSHNWKNAQCTICNMDCGHDFVDGVCEICDTVCIHVWNNGECAICGKLCKHNWYNEKCLICNVPCSHQWQEGVCIHCEKQCKHDWNLGTCNVCTLKCQHDFVDGYCRICLSDCDHKWEDSTCTECNKVCDAHYYVDGKCAVCEHLEPVYYLFGFINGADYGTGEDADNIGIYKFENGTLTAKFTTDSYVAVKTEQNDLFYMTNGYQGDNVTLTVLYNTKILGDKSDKLFVPKGREITFTLIDNGNDSFTLMYVAAPCEHTNHDVNGICSDCGAKALHSFKDGFCSFCGLECTHNFYNGKCSVCGGNCEHNWENEKCTICLTVCKHSFSEGICTECSKVCDHEFSDGGCTNCGMICSHNFIDGVCQSCGFICYHNFVNGICDFCNKECDHLWINGQCKKCDLVCEHNYSKGVCTSCGTKCEHTYSKDACTNCGISKYYLVGYINKKTVGYNEDYLNLGDYAFENGSVTVNIKYDSYFFLKTSDNKNWYMATPDSNGMFTLLENTKNGEAEDMIFIPGGVTAEFTTYAGKNDTVGLIYTIESCIHRLHSTDGYCLACEEKVEHKYSGGVCTGCMAIKPKQDMYLMGIINGAEYGYGSDSKNLGSYKFVNDTLTVTFTEDSYIGIKSKDNNDWYMTNTSMPEGATTAIMVNTREAEESELFFIPGGVEYKITLIDNDNDTFTLSYMSKAASEFNLKTKFVELNAGPEFTYKVYFKAESNDNLETSEMGLLIFDRNVAAGSIDDASKVIIGAKSEGDYFVIETDSIDAQNLVDTMNFRVYAKLTDGTYVYSGVMAYSTVRYAHSVISSKFTTTQQKDSMISLLNYIAAAQIYHGYKVDNLANAGIK